MDFVKHEDMHIDGTHEPKRHLLKINNRCSRVLRSAKRSQNLGVKSALAGFACQLQSQDPRPLNPCRTVEQWWVIAAELLHDHGLAHATVAIDCNARHTGGTRMVEKPI